MRILNFILTAVSFTLVTLPTINAQSMVEVTLEGKIVGVPMEAIDLIELDGPVKRQRFLLLMHTDKKDVSPQIILVENHYTDKKHALNLSSLAKRSTVRFEARRLTEDCTQALVDTNGCSKVRWFETEPEITGHYVQACYMITRNSIRFPK